MNNWDVAIKVLAGLLKSGVTEFVVCGGARNAILLEVLSRLEAEGKVRVWSHFEERSAGFFALGRTVFTGKPCGVVVTSGTAVAELLPAVIEGYYQARPLVLVTADRPEAFRGSGAPQAVEQVGIFAEYASLDPHKWDGKGPLHLNVELEEELDSGDAGLPGMEVGDFSLNYGRPNVGGFAKWLREPTLRGLVVMIGDLEPDEQEEVYHFCEALAVPVLAEGGSGLREALQHLMIIDADDVLAKNPPSKVLRLGGVPSGRFWRDLEDLPKVGVWSICRNGMRGLGRDADVLQGSLARILPALGDVDEIGDMNELLVGAEGRGQRIEEMLEASPDSEAGWMRTLSVYAAIGSSVYLGNSLPIREWNRYAQWERPVHRVRANRGANGIDGQISSWLGSSAEEEDAWGIFGDLTALYDFAGLKMLDQVVGKGRVMVVINNGGGQIFSKIPRLEKMSDKAKEWMAAQAEVDFEGFAKAWGMNFIRVTRADEFDGIEESDVVTLIEVVIR
ncbi:thiamine pyrophosphate-binding protein [Luteolibacter sp. AS25]|uniref:thiamine pyrophosphate-binding protein n=1 Tax=Luteolibacter sp. AS25 TaxID=3135776 RepID=UPI00398AF050